MKAPFPWFGGKRQVAAVVWQRLGDVAVYAEPFAGSLAVLLARPEHEWRAGRMETVNDLDAFVSNAWRAILHDPEATARAADWPVNENDLHARHAWLTARRAQLRARVEGDPDYFDAKIAGWWLWGVSCWIGGGFCSGDGPWQSVEITPGDRQLVDLGNAGQGVRRQRVHLGNAGQGVNRKLVHLGDAGLGVNRQLVHLGNAGRGVNRQLDAGLLEWLLSLSERLRRVRVCSGDWRRILTPAALGGSVPRGILLDPPYGDANRNDCYSEESRTVAQDCLTWCALAGRDPNLRIALCGYEGEHDVLAREHDWSVHAWTAIGGMSSDRGAGSGGNNERERIWFSPGCLAEAQRSLFAERE